MLYITPKLCAISAKQYEQEHEQEYDDPDLCAITARQYEQEHEQEYNDPDLCAITARQYKQEHEQEHDDPNPDFCAITARQYEPQDPHPGFIWGRSYVVTCLFPSLFFPLRPPNVLVLLYPTVQSSIGLIWKPLYVNLL